LNKAAGLLLAAGASSRMGRLKQLLPLGEVTLLDHVLRQTLFSELDQVLLILGCRAREILQNLHTDLHHPKLIVLENPEYGDGISSSVLCGLRRIEDDFDHVMIILGDMPHITSDLINLLLREYLASGLPLGAVKTNRGRSHPVIVGRKFYPDLHKLRGDVGARDLFARFPQDLCLVDPGGNYQDLDIDTPEDYRLFCDSKGETTGQD